METTPRPPDPAEPADDARRWRAVTARDARADGRFVYAVRTTGVYCRPSCPSRRPKRANVAFYPDAAAAEAAGFRACLRCAPDRPSRAERAVASVQRTLERAVEAGDPTPTLADLGAAAGMSPAHLQRVFTRAAGLSPRAYADALRAERLERALPDAATVTEAQYDAGFGSSRALYERAAADHGMTPGRLRRGGEGVILRWGVFDSRLGRMLLAASERGVAALRFAPEGAPERADGSDAALEAELRGEFPAARLEHDPHALAEPVAAVRAYLANAGRGLELPLDVRATEFQVRVWAALRAIPPGETRSYQELAEMIGRPSAVRAVAGACAANPVALAIPCHRVVRTGGALSGYRWGVERKRTVLELEARADGTD